MPKIVERPVASLEERDGPSAWREDVQQLMGRTFADRHALARALRTDLTGELHRRLLTLLALPTPVRPPPLRRLARHRHRQPSPETTRLLIHLLSIPWRAHQLFGDASVARRWLTRPRRWQADKPTYAPLAQLDRPGERVRIVAAMRRTRHRVW
jgi:hypothetical protein